MGSQLVMILAHPSKVAGRINLKLTAVIAELEQQFGVCEAECVSGRERVWPGTAVFYQEKWLQLTAAIRIQFIYWQKLS